MKGARLLSTARRRAGISQRELSRRSGVPQPSISRIERGLVSPSADTLDVLVRACGMDLEVVEHPGRGVDRTLMRERLRMSPAERLRYTVEATEAVDRLVASRRTAS